MDTKQNFKLLLQCTGKFCGRMSNSSTCTACSWGSRVPSGSSQQYGFCEKCLTPLSIHGWLYLGFLAILPVLFLSLTLPTTGSQNQIFTKKPEKNVVAKSQENMHGLPTPSVEHKTCNKKAWILFLLCIFVHTCSSLITVILYPPFGSLSLYHCGVEKVEDFYAPLLAAPGCSSEVNFPLTSLPIVYYSISAFICLLTYPLLFLVAFRDCTWLKHLYYALYAYPLICIFVLVFGGILYFVFPYFLLFVSLLDSLYRFPLVFDYSIIHPDAIIRPVCNPLILVKDIIRSPGQYFLFILINLLSTGYALLSFFEAFNWCLLLALLPVTFYILTLPLSHPFLHHDCESTLSRMCNITFKQHNIPTPSTSKHPVSNLTSRTNLFRTFRNTSD
ncbi:unnamed protein product [Trichobilharzia szidati]|nr:unnamed protein product [Trichobilharzia szidati]